MTRKEFTRQAREKTTITYKRNPITLSSDFAAETFCARREWNKIFKILKEDNN